MEELNRHKAINKYAKTMIMEQEVPPTDPAAAVPPMDPAAAPVDPAAAPAPDMGAPMDAGVPPMDPATDPAAGAAPAGPDMGADPAMDAQLPAEGGDTQELDVTELVNMTKSIKQQLDNTNNENNSVVAKMDDVFSKLTELEGKLGEMDRVIAKIDELGAKVQQMKPQTPQEKLEMRSLDSYPFNQRPQEFFNHKQDEMRASGKNEYVLTKDDVDNYSKDQILQSFNPKQDDNNEYATRY